MYGGEGSRAITRDFPYIFDKKLLEIVTRDYKKSSLILFPGGAWKSSVILAGSILEAILVDVITSDPKLNKNAANWPSAPKKRGGKVKDIAKGEWTLHNLIEVSVFLGLIPKERADTFDQVIRD